MKQHKLHTASWYLLGLAALLLLGCVIGTVGSSFARYRSQVEGDIRFQARSPEEVFLGTLSEDGTVFLPSSSASWVTENGQSVMRFAVANGNSEENYAQTDMQAAIRLVGSLGVCQTEEDLTVTLAVPRAAEAATADLSGEDAVAAQTETDPTELLEPAAMEYDVFQATAQRITQQSPLYTSFGEGWVFFFLDDDKNEVTWLLKGGEHAVTEMILTIDGIRSDAVNLVQLQVTGR